MDLRLLAPKPVRRFDGPIVKLAILRQRLDVGASGELPGRRKNALFVKDGSNAGWLPVVAHKHLCWNAGPS